MIILDSKFDVKTSGELSTIEFAEAIFKYSTNDDFLKTEFITLISESKGMTKSSVDGTCFGGDITPPPNKIMGKAVFKNDWVMCKSSTGRVRFARIGTQKDKNRIVKTYDTPAKRKARQDGPEKCLRTFRKKHPVIITLAGECGHDVKGFLKISPGADIYNVESNPLVFDEITKLKLKITNYFGTLGNFIEDCPDKFADVINYDTHGYVCGELLKTLEIINRKKASKFVCLTIQHQKAFRNHGSVATYLRLQYGHCEDPILECFNQEFMQNYKIIKDFTYKREKGKAAVMRTLTFRLK